MGEAAIHSGIVNKSTKDGSCFEDGSQFIDTFHSL